MDQRHSVSGTPEGGQCPLMYFVSFEVNRRRCVFGPFETAEAANEGSNLYRGERNLADNFCLIRAGLACVWVVSVQHASGNPCFHGPFLREKDAVEYAGILSGASVHGITKQAGEFFMDGLAACLRGPPCLRKI